MPEASKPGLTRRDLLTAAAGVAGAAALESPLARIARAMTYPGQTESVENSPAQSQPEIFDYENARILGGLPAHSPDSMTQTSDGRIAFSTSTYEPNKDDMFHVHLGTTRPESISQQLEIYNVDPVDSRAIVQTGYKDNKIRAAFVNADNHVIVRTYNVDFQVESDTDLGTWFNEAAKPNTPLKQHAETFFIDSTDSLKGDITYWVSAFNILPVNGKQSAVLAQQTTPQITPGPDKQPQAHFKMMIADLETGEDIKVEGSAPVRRPGEVVYWGDDIMGEIFSDGEDILALTQLGLWRTSKDQATNQWSTQFEPFDIPKLPRVEMSYPHSVSFDPKTGDILYATSMADVYCGVLKRNPDGKGWTSTENQLVLKNSDEEPWNGIVGGLDYVRLPQTRPNDSEDVVLMLPAVWFGPPFDINKMFGIVQEPVLYRDGKFTRSNQNRTRGTWELQGYATDQQALVLNSNYEEPVLHLQAIDYKGLKPAAPKPTATARPTETPIPTATSRVISRRNLFLPRVSR